MKRSLAILLLLAKLQAGAQIIDPVKWEYAAKKTGDAYEVRLTAKIESPWHIYSQFNKEGGPVPSKITFNKNPLITLIGMTKEEGKLVTKREDVFNMDVKYFRDEVSFVQRVALRQASRKERDRQADKIKTKIEGTITYMVCNDVQCLAPKTIPFSIALK